MSIDLDTIEAREKAAHDHIRDLCLGKKRWTMRVPADPQNDSDLVISRSLRDVSDLVAEVRRLRDVVDQVRELVLPSADMAEDEDLYGVVVDIRRLVYEHDSTVGEDRESEDA